MGVVSTLMGTFYEGYYLGFKATKKNLETTGTIVPYSITCMYVLKSVHIHDDLKIRI